MDSRATNLSIPDVDSAAFLKNAETVFVRLEAVEP